jgi:hypothetical protein
MKKGKAQEPVKEITQGYLEMLMTNRRDALVLKEQMRIWVTRTVARWSKGQKLGSFVLASSWFPSIIQRDSKILVGMSKPAILITLEEFESETLVRLIDAMERPDNPDAGSPTLGK